MKRSVIPAALLVLLAATACGERQANGVPEAPLGAGSPSLTLPPKPTSAVAPPETTEPARPGLTTGPSGVVAPAGYTPLPPGQVDDRRMPGEVDYDKRVWVSADGRALALFAVAPTPCTPMEATVTAADPRQVRLAVAPMAQPQGGPEGQACAQVIAPVPVSAMLEDALGDRRVVLTTGP
ncbi:hypothetical protein [Actinokineospora sp. NPDC004072]